MKCDHCNKEMTSPGTISCIVAPVVFKDGESLPQVTEESFYDNEVRCPDCGIMAGNPHHPGCDTEECPRCHGQLIGCDCELEGGYKDEDN